MDILEALADAAPPAATSACKIQRWLDTIPANTPGLADLVATISSTDPTDPAYRTQQQTASVLKRLGLSTTYLAVGNHRGKRCGCFA